MLIYMNMIYVFEIIVFLFSAIIHEYMHGWMDLRLGDTTARDAGRLSFNPLVHLEWFGSFFLPLILLLTSSPFVFGWAKPVPYNPNNLKDRRWGDAKVGIAGPLGNLVIALFFGLLLRFLPLFSLAFASLLSLIVYINLVLMFFNLVPLPPLDGSKVISAFLPERAKYLSLERYGFIFVIAFVLLAGEAIVPVVDFLYRAIVGI